MDQEGLVLVLTVGTYDVLSAEEAGINGPGTRSDHGQCDAQGRQEDGDPRVTGMRIGDPQLNHGHERTSQGRP